MKYILLIIVVFSLVSCKETKPKKTEIQIENEVEDISEATIFTSYENVHRLIQGSWSNAFEPNSVIIFKENTTTNTYQGAISQENVPYSIGTSCAIEVTTKSSSAFRYITTKGAYTECYYITALDENTLVMEFEKGDITLTFSRVNSDL